METLTVKEAIEQGYTKFLYEGEGFQSLRDIEEITEDDFKIGVELVERETSTPTGMSSKDIAEMIAEQLQCDHTDACGDDTNDVYDSIKKLDFSDMEKKITAALSELSYYKSSGIKLIK